MARKIQLSDIEAADRFLNPDDEFFNEGAQNDDADDGPVEMDIDKLAAIISGELTDAVRFVDLEIGQERARAVQMYRGWMPGDEAGMEGRSTIVSRDVHDTVQGQLPDLLRILLGPERICEFDPATAEDVEWVEQATQYAQYVVERDNDGFSILYEAIKDALVVKTGIVKYWWDDREEVKVERYTGLDDDAVWLLDQDAGVESIELTPQPVNEQLIDFKTGQPMQLYDVVVKRRFKNGRIKLAALPPEEFILDRRATSLDNFTLCGHRSMKTVSELTSMGYEEDEVRRFVTSPELDTNREYIVRQPYARAVGSFDALNPATQRVLYVEAYGWVDYDGDGIAELHRICTMGPAYKVVFHEQVDHIPFADFHVDPEPHTFFGLSTADKTMDIQRIKTQIQRNMLDSLAQSIHPRTAVVEGQVNMDDVLNNEVGAVIRMRQAGMVQPLETPFVGEQALGVLDYVDATREMRTGVSRQSMGLNAADLQSTNGQAIEQAITGSQGKIEVIARIMANGMRKLYKGILHLIVQNQDRPRTIRLNGQFVPMDPRTWSADVGVKINVALGSGTQSQKIATLMAIIAKMEMIFQVMGQNQPIVTPQNYANALRKLCELNGWRNPDQFFNQVPAGWQAPKPQPPPPTMQDQIAMQQLQLDQQKLQFEREKALWQVQTERDKNVSDALLKSKDIEYKYRANVGNAAVQQAEGHIDRFHDAGMQMADHAHQKHVEQMRQNMQGGLAVLGHAADAYHAGAAQAHETAGAAAQRQHEAEQNAQNNAHQAGMQAMQQANEPTGDDNE